MKKYSLVENSPNANIGWLGFIGMTSKELLDPGGSQPFSAKSAFCLSEDAWSLVSLLPCLAQNILSYSFSI